MRSSERTTDSGVAVPATSTQGGTLSVVVPCFNEEAHVRDLLERVLQVSMPAGWEREVVLIDDGSTDKTPEILATLALPVRILTRATNGGKGTALVDGFKEVTGTHVLIQDADLEYEPHEIPSLLTALDAARATLGEHADRVVVYGSRNLLPGKRKGKKLLQAGVWFITKLINFLYGTKLTDASTCYKLFPRTAIPLFKTGGFDSDILFDPALIRAGYEIIEVPISYEPRSAAAGKKIKYRDGIKAIFALIKDYRESRRASGIMGSRI